MTPPEIPTDAPQGREPGDAPSNSAARRPLPGRAWAIVLAASLIAGGLGFLAGQQTGTTSYALATGGEITPGAGGTAGEGPTPLADGTYDASIFGPGTALTDTVDITAIHRRDAADPFAIGAVDAPVVISEFSDTECPFCARYRNETESRIIEKYVDTGLVRIEWNDMPINGENAEAGARAVRAAAEQGKFHEFTTELYANHPTTGGHPNFSTEDYVAFAEAAGVADIDTFRTHATDDTYTRVVAEAGSYAQQIGVTGTPSFLVGTQFISGAQPFESFERTILGELAVLGLAESGD